MQPKNLLGVLLILCTGVRSAPDECGQKCSGISNRFNFKKGASYVYNYESSTKVQLVGNSDKAPGVSLKAKATISVLDKCKYQLQLSDVQFNGPPATEVGFDLAQELAKHPLAFTYDNGAVRDICPIDLEHHDALNVKRGILSTFQLSNDFDAEDAYETDITGNCPVVNSVRQEGDTKVITEKKNLLSCRNHVYTSFRLVPYTVASKIQNAPAVNASQTCIYRVQQGILKEANCQESHDLLAFKSNYGGGVSSNIQSKLTFAQEGPAAAAAPVGQSQTLHFNQKPIVIRESKEAVIRARSQIKLLQDTAAKEVRPESPGHFHELVYILKAVSFEDLQALAKEVKAAPSKQRRIFIDSVSQCGTPNCVRLLIQLLTPKKKPNVPALTPMDQRFVQINLALTHYPDESGVAAVTAALNDLPDEALFSATALVNNYIRQNPKRKESAEVKQFIQNYLGFLAKLAPSSKQTDNDKLIKALRALGNLAHIQEGINERLAYLEKQTPIIDVTLAAIQSLRRAPCVPAMEKKLYSLFTDARISVEIRLNAFMVLVGQCATKELIGRIANYTSYENKFNQIGSFVQNYFSAQRDSKDPSVDKNVFTKAFLKKKYPGNSGHYSRFSQYSSFSHDKNLGYHLDTASIYVPEDAYPRQGSVNITLDLWGSEVNVLELGFRNDHLHDVADNLFGPEGYFSESVLAGDREVRKKDDKHPKLAEYQKAFDAKHKIAKELDISFYTRVFGDELSWYGAYDVNVIDRFREMTNVQGMQNLLTDEKSASFYVHRLPYDSSATVPVISGFPLRLSSNGSIVLNIDASMKANVKDAENGNAEIKFRLKPSAAYQASCHMAVYTGHVRNGVQYSRNSHSATAVEFELQYSKHEQVTAKLVLPKARQEFYSVETKIHSIINNVPIEEKGVVANRGDGKMCAPSALNRYTGFKICTQISYPNASYVKESPYFPLTGPFKASFFVEKDDPELKSYELAASWKATPTGRDVIFKYDTPKTKINRQRTLTFNYVRQKSINMVFQSPTNKVTAVGTLEAAGDDNTGAKIQTNINGKIYDFVGKIKRQTKPDSYRKYDFDGEVKTADAPKPGHLTGALELQPGRKYALNANLPDLYDKPISITARAEKDKGKLTVEYDYKGLEGPKRIAGDISLRSPADMDYKFDITYFQKTSQKPHTVTYEHKHLINLSPKQSKVASNSKISSSLYPAANYAYDVLYEQKPDKIEIKASTIEGGHQGINIEGVANTKPNDYSVNILLQYPPAKIHQSGAVIYRQDPAKGYEASATYKDVSNNKEAKASFKAKGRRSDGPSIFIGDASADLKLPALGQEYKIEGSVKQGATPDEAILTITALLPQNRKAEIRSTYKGKHGDFERKDFIHLPDMDPFELTERIKYIDQDYVYNCDLKKKGASVVTISANLNRKDAAKNVAKFRIQAQEQQVDYGFDGIYQPPGANYRITGTVLKNNKPYIKNDVGIPLSFTRDENKEARFYVTYDLGQAPEKSIKIDYKTEKAGNAVSHNAIVDVNLPNADYKFDFTRRHNEATANNLTVYQQDKPIIQVNVGRLQKAPGPNGQSGYVDVNVKTFAPAYTPRDLAGRLNFDTNPKNYKGDFYLADRQQKQEISVNIEAAKISNGYDKKLTVKANEIEVEVKNKYAAQPNDAGVDISGAASVKLQGKPGSYKWSYSSAPNRVQVDLETPIPNFNKASFSALRGQEGSLKTIKYDLTLGKDTTNVQSKYDYSNNNILLDMTIKSSLAALKNIQYTVKNDQRKGLDAGFTLNVNDVHKLNTFYRLSKDSNGEEKYGIGIGAKLGNAYEWDTSSDSSWNDKSGKYVTKNNVQTSPKNKYRVDVSLDTNTMDVKVDLENIPGIKAPVTGKAKKVGDNEYEIALQDATGPNKGLVGFKFTGPSQKLRLETAAFKSSIESEYTATRFAVGANIVPDPAVPTKAYGLKYSADAPNEFSRSADLQVTYPERTLGISSKRIRQPNAKLDQTVELNLNAGKRQPVKIQYTAAKTPGKMSCEAHLNDQTIPDGLHILGNYAKTGNVENDDSDYSLNGDITLQYSKDPQRHLIIRKENKRQVVNKRSKVSTSLELQHQASNLNHKIYNTYLLEPCAEGAQDCEYAFTIGARYPMPSKAIEEISVDIQRSDNKLEALFVSGPNKFKLARKQGKGLRSYSISKNDKELYDINAELVRQGQPSFAVSIIEKEKNAVLLRASATLQGNDLATIQVQHDESGKTVNDIDATFKLESSKLLKVKYFRRPGLAEAFNNYIKQLPSPKSIINLPVMQSHTSIAKEISETLKPFFESLDKEEDAIAKELQFTSGKLSKSLKEQSDNIGEAINFAIDSVTTFSATAAGTLNNVTKSYRDAAREFAGRLPDFNKNVVVPVRDSIAVLGQRSADLYNRTSQAFNNAYSGSKLNEFVDQAMKLYREAGPGSPQQKMLSIYRKLSKSAVPSGPGMMDQYDQIRQARAKDVADLWAQIRPSLIVNDDYKEVTEFFDQVASKIQWYIQYKDPSLPADAPKSKGWTLFQVPEVPYYTKSTFNYSTDPTTKTVSLNAIIPLTRDYTSLRDLAESLMPDRLSATAMGYKEKVEDFLDKVFGVDDGLPDGESRGLVVGQQHIVTFDGQSKAISTDCSYLLAKDFIDSLFSVQIQYNKAGNNIIIEYGGKKITMTVDGKVLVDNQQTELPVQISDENSRVKVSVERINNQLTRTKTFNGLEVECNSHTRICIVKLDDRFRGRTNGLLGRNDGEPFTDNYMPDEVPAASTDVYLKVWALESKCAGSQNSPAASELPKAHPSFQDCKRLFTGRTKCPRVDQASFHALCLNNAQRFVDQEKDASRHNRSVCQSQAAFLSVCPNAGENLVQCIECELPGGKIPLYESKEIEQAAKGAARTDIVFVVDNRDCLQASKDRLGNVAQKIEANVKQTADVKFGLVSFNGQNDSKVPLTYTHQSQVSFSADGLKAAASRLGFPVNTMLDNQKPISVLQHVADNYPFRAASRKVLVLFSCRNCQTIELDYNSLQSKLLSNNIALHLVTPNDITFSQEMADAVIGFDAKAFIKADGSRNVAARSELAEPYDSCTVLAQETNGTVFSVARDADYDYVFNALATEVSRTAKESQCNVCECTADDNAPWTNCYPCNIPSPTYLTPDKTGFLSNPFNTLKKAVDPQQSA